MTEKRFRIAYEYRGAWDTVSCKKLSYEEIIYLLNAQDRKIKQLEKSIEQREEQISIIKKHCFKFLTDEQFETIRKELEDE